MNRFVELISLLEIERFRSSEGHKPVAADPHTLARLQKNTLKAQSLEFLTDGIWLWDIPRDHVTYSERWRNILGYADPTEIGESPAAFFDRVHPDHLPKIKDKIRGVLMGEVDRYSSELMMRCKDGSWKWVLVRGEVISRDEEGSPLQLAGTHTDLTSFQEHQRELVSAKEQAERAAAARTDFLANMSHEIRTPLNGIIGMAQLALETKLSAEQHEFVATIEWSAQTLLSIINDILDFSKAEAGKLQLVSAPVDVQDVLEGVIMMLASQAREKEIQIKVGSISPLPPFLLTDEARIRQILLNLLGNALKFTPPSGVVSISLGFTEDANHSPHGTLEMIVADTGIGIDPGDIKRIFEPFSQADRLNTKRFGGTGLGLTITKRLVELLYGSITVSSTPGVGSEFRVTLPAEIAVSRSANSGTHPVPGTTVAPPTSSSTILLVEDNLVNAKVASKLLAKHGYTVLHAQNGQEALSLYEAHLPSPVSLILMDCQMPIMNGYDATRSIREIENKLGMRTPIIAMTAFALEGDRQKCIDCGMDDYIAKPLDQRQFFQTIEVWLKGPNLKQPLRNC